MAFNFFKSMKKKATSHNASPVGAKSASEALVSFDNVTLSHDGVKVIENLSFEICTGDYFCIIGESGSGKSTVMRAILGLLKQSSGKITLNNLKRNQIGVLPQQSPVPRDFMATVEEVVTSGCINRCSKGGFMSSEAKKIAAENMERVGVLDLASRPLRDLSGGQQQRVALARALCSAEKMLVLDEPVAGLDAQSNSDIYTLINDLNRLCGMTVVLVTHDISPALRYGTKILRINKDSVFLGSREEFAKLVGIELT